MNGPDPQLGKSDLCLLSTQLFSIPIAGTSCSSNKVVLVVQRWKWDWIHARLQIPVELALKRIKVDKIPAGQRNPSRLTLLRQWFEVRLRHFTTKSRARTLTYRAGSSVRPGVRSNFEIIWVAVKSGKGLAHTPFDATCRT